MQITNEQRSEITCPECGSLFWVHFPAGTEIGKIDDNECPQGHAVRARLDDGGASVAPADLDL